MESARRVTNGLGGVKPNGRRTEAPVVFLYLSQSSRYTPRTMSIRKAGGDWEPMLLPIEPRHCKVCQQGLYRDKTMFRGGWSRCTLCDEFVHYSCLASGKVSFLKARPRVCKAWRAAQEGASAPSVKKDETPVAVGT
jgi:hypothetical protein